MTYAQQRSQFVTVPLENLAVDLIDLLVERKDIRETLADLLEWFAHGRRT